MARRSDVFRPCVLPPELVVFLGISRSRFTCRSPAAHALILVPVRIARVHLAGCLFSKRTVSFGVLAPYSVRLLTGETLPHLSAHSTVLPGLSSASTCCTSSSAKTRPRYTRGV